MQRINLLPLKRKTIFITGCSSGIGRSAAWYFFNQGWNVVATMRRPDLEKELNQLGDSVAVFRLDVNDSESIRLAFEAGLIKFGAIDVVVNNAGYGLIGIFETFSEDQLLRQFQTNVLGLMTVTKIALNYFRTQSVKGVIINVSSVVGQVSLPSYSVYCSTKFAVEGFTEALQFEAQTIGVKLKLVEPGTTRTDFFGRSADRHAESQVPEVYRPFLDGIDQKMGLIQKYSASADAVAKTIFKAATDESSRLRYPVGFGPTFMMGLRKILPDCFYHWLILKGVT